MKAKPKRGVDDPDSKRRLAPESLGGINLRPKIVFSQLII